jgi:hypothetical protein
MNDKFYMEQTELCIWIRNVFVQCLGKVIIIRGDRQKPNVSATPNPKIYIYTSMYAIAQHSTQIGAGDLSFCCQFSMW